MLVAGFHIVRTRNGALYHVMQFEMSDGKHLYFMDVQDGGDNHFFNDTNVLEDLTNCHPYENHYDITEVYRLDTCISNMDIKDNLVPVWKGNNGAKYFSMEDLRNHFGCEVIIT